MEGAVGTSSTRVGTRRGLPGMTMGARCEPLATGVRWERPWAGSTGKGVIWELLANGVGGVGTGVVHECDRARATAGRERWQGESDDRARATEAGWTRRRKEQSDVEVANFLSHRGRCGKMASRWRNGTAISCPISSTSAARLGARKVGDNAGGPELVERAMRGARKLVAVLFEEGALDETDVYVHAGFGPEKYGGGVREKNDASPTQTGRTSQKGSGADAKFIECSPASVYHHFHHSLATRTATRQNASDDYDFILRECICAGTPHLGTCKDSSRILIFETFSTIYCRSFPERD
ncbi:hypothetical protein K438DRAFT_1786874 [Mycena galopus ATCC 62051]|nr:hypothetical protein K438DRAFT_1786874 [Mycena galopus ATCC 62051]